MKRKESSLRHEPRPRPSADQMDLGKLVQIVTRDSTAKRHALPRVVFVVGATASGKTKLGLRLAKQLGGEVINADARQVYRQVDIGTGKPNGKRMRWHGRQVFMVDGIPHHLMDFLPPEKTYTAAEWRDAALKVIRSIVKRGHLPIFVGGTGLYVSSLLDNYQFPKVEPQPAMRAAFESKPLEELVRLLLAVDPDAAQVVDLKNKRRVVRALEVVTFSGKKFSEARGRAEPLVDAFQVGIHHPSDVLYARVDKAIEKMVDEGLIDEVRALIKKGIDPHAPAMTSIGYQDIMRYLNGEITLEESVTLMKRRTRQYTKRQWTWFKRDPRIRWAHDADEAMELVEQWVGEAE